MCLILLQKLKNKGDLTPKSKRERAKKKEDEESITTVENAKIDGNEKINQKLIENRKYQVHY